MTRMAFVMPSKYTMETLPRPVDPRITLREEPEEFTAVVRFSGLPNDAAYDRWTKVLRDEIARDKLQAIGEPRLFVYNSPFTLPWTRTNEVAIAVDQAAVHALIAERTLVANTVGASL
eukprot:Unigene11868_Nuclearia_a/m.36137 Unigene11868_Nuclearia_a/g.36137  ORF Unigene11868_Nuclearia_a/g.36137 Unigene11868_Nuclearia_a/m.36137 type:complete len:118 (-) Unigene11868_Nuclearia_a:42-395(-)